MLPQEDFEALFPAFPSQGTSVEPGDISHGSQTPIQESTVKTLRLIYLAVMFLVGGLLGPAAPVSANDSNSNTYLFSGNLYMAYADYYAEVGYAYNAYAYAAAATDYYWAGYSYSTSATIDDYAYNAYVNAAAARDNWYAAYYNSGGLNYYYYGYYGALYSLNASSYGAAASYLTPYY